MSGSVRRPGERLRVLLVEPYFTGSHRAWAVGYAKASSHDVRSITLPGRFWKWRMHGGALTCARMMLEAGAEDPWRPDVILASDMLDLTTFLAATRHHLGAVPAAIYVHENQLAYPARPPRGEWSDSRRRRSERDARDAHYAFINAASFSVADRVLWNSEHNRSSFLQRLPEFLRSFPDHRELGLVEEIAGQSEILPLGLDLASLDGFHPGTDPAPGPRPPLIIWSHRWEYDKDPEAFFAALSAVADAGGHFQVAVLGERFGSAPREFDAARRRLGERIVHFGFVDARADYAEWLWRADLVVSTARHEFFGASTCEALYCGCDALLPNRLAYPEIVPEWAHRDVLYEDHEALVQRLLEVCRSATLDGPRRAPSGLREAVARFDWSVQAPVYDAVLRSVAERPRAGGDEIDHPLQAVGR